MPGLEFNSLPAAETENPFAILDTKFKQLNQTTRLKEQEFRTKQVGPEGITALQTEYNNRVLKLKQLRSNLMQVQSLVSQNKISKDAGDKAMWRMVLPEETSRAMFPTAVGEDVIPPSQLTSEVQKRAILYSDAAKGWGSKNQRDLVPQYKEFRNRVALVFGVEGYENLSGIQKKQIDAEWDLVQKDKGNEWNPESPEIATVRTTGTLGRAASKLVSPIAASVQGEGLKGKLFGALDKWAKAGPMTSDTAETFRNRQEGTATLKPTYAINRTTGQRILSVDGGQTWQIVK
jgi:hypothetical protein